MSQFFKMKFKKPILKYVTSAECTKTAILWAIRNIFETLVNFWFQGILRNIHVQFLFLLEVSKNQKYTKII